MGTWLSIVHPALLLTLLIPGTVGDTAAALTRSRPDPENGATVVRVALYIADITKINNIDQSFTAVCIMRLRWVDPRISATGTRIALNELWHPNVVIYNLRSREQLLDESVVVLPDNVVQYTQQYYGEFSSPLDFRDFPFDIQRLPIILVSSGNRPDEVKLVVDGVGREEMLSLFGWTVEPPRAEADTVDVALFASGREAIERPRVTFQLDARRHLDYYWWKVLIPMSVILMLSWAVFWIDPAHISAQISVGATSILTMIAFLLRLESIIPPVSYLTRLDRFVFVCLGLLLLAFIEAVATSRLANSPDSRAMAMAMDRWSRALFPVTYGIIVALFWLR